MSGPKALNYISVPATSEKVGGGWRDIGGQGCGCFHVWDPAVLVNQVRPSGGISVSNVSVTRSVAADKQGAAGRVRRVFTTRG